MAKLIRIADEIVAKGLDNCNFTFSREEIILNRGNDFYLYLLGRHKNRQNKAWLYPNCVSNYLDTGYYKIGQRYAFEEPEEPKPRLLKLLKKINKTEFKTIGYVPYEFYTDRHPTRYSWAHINGVKIPFKVLLDHIEYYQPLPGINPTKSINKCPYKYSIGVSTYYFCWKRPVRFIDVTRVFSGQMDWPENLNKIIFDRKLDITKVYIGYPYLYYLLTKGYKFATKKNYMEFIACTR